TGADGAVAVRQPGQAGLRVAGGGEPFGETGLRRPAVMVGQYGEVQAFGGAGELGRQLVGGGVGQRPGLGRVAAVGIAPLHHEVVVRAVDAQAVVPARLRQCADVGDV